MSLTRNAGVPPWQPGSLADIDRARKGVSSRTARQYLTSLRDFGGASYTTYIVDGHFEYFNVTGNTLSSSAARPAYEISAEADGESARRALDAHGRGEIDYLTFVGQLAAAGVCTWVIDLREA